MKRVLRLFAAGIVLGSAVFLIGDRALATGDSSGPQAPVPTMPSVTSGVSEGSGTNGPTGADASAASTVRHEAVRLQGLCLLAEPVAGTATKKVLRAGEVVRVVATDGPWVEIEVRGGVRGYVLGGYLTGFSLEAPMYRDRLVQVARRPGAGDAVGSLLETRTVSGTEGHDAALQAPATAGPDARMPIPLEGSSMPSAQTHAVAPGPAQTAISSPVPTAEAVSGVSSSSSETPAARGAVVPDEVSDAAPDAVPDAAAGQGASASRPAPDPQGGDRLVAYVLEQLRRPAPTNPEDRLDAAGREHYERKNRYMIEVFLADNTMILYEKQPDGVRRPAKSYRVATPAGDVEAPAGWGVITQIEFEPWWRPTENMKRRARQKGRSLPDVMPPGVKNPMGPFKMHLSHGFAYRIHGNNDPKSIGRRVTNGCIRMRNDEGLELARILDVGTEVVISGHASPAAGQGVEALAPRP